MNLHPVIKQNFMVYKINILNDMGMLERSLSAVEDHWKTEDIHKITTYNFFSIECT